MKQNRIALKTLAMKAKVANFLRTKFYGYSNREWDLKYKSKKSLTEFITKDFIDELYNEVQLMNEELRFYKQKRQNKAKLLEKRLAAYPTKTMIKKLRGKVKKNLVESIK